MAVVYNLFEDSWEDEKLDLLCWLLQKAELRPQSINFGKETELSF